MKKALLVGLIVLLVAMPCLAGIEADYLSSIEGTVWLSTVIDSSHPELIGESHYHAFYKGDVYISGELYILKHSAYVEFPQASFFLIIREPKSFNPNKSVIGLMYPLGMGIAFDGANIFLLHKINDNWIPPRVG